MNQEQLNVLNEVSRGLRPKILEDKDVLYNNDSYLMFKVFND